MKNKVVFFDNATAYYVRNILQCCLGEHEDPNESFLEGFKTASTPNILEYNCADMSLCRLVSEGAIPPLYFKEIKTTPLGSKIN